MPLKLHVSNVLTRGAQLHGRALRQSMPFVIGAGCIWLVMQQLEPGSLSGVPSALRDVPVLNWAGALIATLLSFWALGRYDAIFHRLFRTSIPARAAGLSGASAIAMGQVLGMGVVTGALVRWRILPGLSAAEASKISLAVAVSFMVCLAGLVGVAGALWGAHLVPVWISVVLIILFVTGALFSVLQPALRFGSRRVSLPPLPAILRMFWLSALDTAFAATALYLLLPQGLSLDWPLLYTVYLLGLSGALLSGTPGGVGPFELALLAALPAVPEADLLGAIVAFRLVYYATPAVAALPLLAFPIRPRKGPSSSLLTTPTSRDLSRAKRSELGVCRQNGAQFLTAGGARLAVITTAQTMTAVFDPLGPATMGMFPALARQARDQNQCALVYKCSARVAAMGRNAGWSTLHIADEAVLDPQRFSPQGRAFRQLRRKLRQAETAGVDLSAPATLPRAELARIDAEWCARQGTARGVSMGRFCAGYLSAQKVYIARQGADIVGFVSFHANSSEMCLDLMRTSADAPQGTMHLLICHAIQMAADEGFARLSLAALPRPPSNSMSVAEMLINKAQNAGLTQFKSTFAPKREPLYALAPSPAALALGLTDMALSIRFPPQ